MCFNPRAHVGRDAFMSITACVVSVSIHAPTWGATPTPITTVQQRIVSIHAPTWGATSISAFVNPSKTFQSTRPRGARPDTFAAAFARRVSIHAPTWGATRPICAAHQRQDVSIHAPTWGATAANGKTTYAEQFQSTRPRGARLVGLLFVADDNDVSIHAPTWGAT